MPEPTEVYRPHVGVHLILVKDGKVLLLQRADTGFADGCWSVPGGCLDEGETFFTATRWTGEPRNAEPSKASKIDWFDLDDLPEEIVTYVRTAIHGHRQGDAFSLDNWSRGLHG